MSANLERVWSVMKRIAPLKLAESWLSKWNPITTRDNVGVLLSPLKEKVIDGKLKILLCNDIVDSVLLIGLYQLQVVDEAIEMNAGAIIAYHPIIFHGIKRLNPVERVPRILMK